MSGDCVPIKVTLDEHGDLVLGDRVSHLHVDQLVLNHLGEQLMADHSGCFYSDIHGQEIVVDNSSTLDNHRAGVFLGL